MFECLIKKRSGIIIYLYDTANRGSGRNKVVDQSKISDNEKFYLGFLEKGVYSFHKLRKIVIER